MDNAIRIRIFDWWNNQFIKPQLNSKEPLILSNQAFVKWLPENDVLTLKTIGSKRSADVCRDTFVLVQEGYFHSVGNAKPFLYIRRDRLEALYHDFVENQRNEHEALTPKKSQLFNRMEKAIKVLEELGANVSALTDAHLVMAHKLANDLTLAQMTKPKIQRHFLDSACVRATEKIQRLGQQEIVFRAHPSSLEIVEAESSTHLKFGKKGFTFKFTFTLDAKSLALPADHLLNLIVGSSGYRAHQTEMEDLLRPLGLTPELLSGDDWIEQFIRTSQNEEGKLSGVQLQFIDLLFHDVLGRERDYAQVDTDGHKIVITNAFDLRLLRTSKNQKGTRKVVRQKFVIAWPRNFQEKGKILHVFLEYLSGLPIMSGLMRKPLATSGANSETRPTLTFESIEDLEAGTLIDHLKLVRAETISIPMSVSHGLLEASLVGSTWTIRFIDGRLKQLASWRIGKMDDHGELDIHSVLGKVSNALAPLSSFMGASKKSVARKQFNYAIANRRPEIFSGNLDSLVHSAEEFVSALIKKTVEYLEKLRAEEVLHNLLAEKPYHVLHRRYEGPRRVICYLAPTNAGKSYRARKLIAELHQKDRKGEFAALFPLRTLALENQDEFNAMGIPCSLVTGEERELVTGARMVAQTVDTFRAGRQYSGIFIDEAQLAFLPDRGGAYLRAIVSADAHELILTAAPECRQQLEQLFGLTGDHLSFVTLERLCPLEPLEDAISIEAVEKGDLIVAFRVADVHMLATQIRNQGYNVGTLYGAMSPVARREMYHAYQAGKIDVMVSTDAIGMGCNMPASRVLFASTTKFDGERMRRLNPAEIRQIAGRAGRFGRQERGSYGILKNHGHSLGQQDLIKAFASTTAQPIESLWVMPDRERCQDAQMDLVQFLTLWKKAITSHELYKINQRDFEFMLEKALFLDGFIKTNRIPFGKGVELLFVAFHAKNQMADYQVMVRTLADGKKVALPKSNGKSIQELEQQSASLSLLFQVAQVYPELCPETQSISDMHVRSGEALTELLLKTYASKRITSNAP